MTKKEAIHFLYQIADEIRSFLDKTSSPKGQWTSHKRLEALSMAISALYDLFQAEEDGRLIIPPCKVGDTVWVITGTAIKLCTVDRIHILGNGQVQIRAKYFRYESEEEDTDARIKLKAITLPILRQHKAESRSENKQ